MVIVQLAKLTLVARSLKRIRLEESSESNDVMGSWGLGGLEATKEHICKVFNCKPLQLNTLQISLYIIYLSLYVCILPKFGNIETGASIWWSFWPGSNL